MAFRPGDGDGGLLQAPTPVPFCRSLARLNQRATVVEPLSAPVTASEESLSSTCTEISKMKGQSLQSSINARLIGVNLRFITYAMKEGQVRVINQNGKDMFRIGNTQEAHILDLSLNGSGERQAPQSIVITVDSAARVAINQLEAKWSQVEGGNKRTKCMELVFPLAEQPHRVLGHPTDSKIFATLHDSSFIVWNISLLEKEIPSGEGKRKHQQAKEEDSFDIYNVNEDLLSTCGLKASVSSMEGSLLSSTATLLDGSFTSEGDLFVALTEDAVVVWRVTLNTTRTWNRNLPGHAAGLERLQTIPLANISEAGNMMLEKLTSLRVLRAVQRMGRKSADAVDSLWLPSSPESAGAGARQPPSGSEIAEVLVLAAANTCFFAAFELFPKRNQPVGRLVQTIRLDKQAERAVAQCISVDSLGRDYLTVALKGDHCICVLPLALNWCGASSGLPFPCLHRVFTDEPTHQLSAMTGRSYNVEGQGLFLYRAHNFTREKDKLAGCHVMVNEIPEDGVPRQEAFPCPELELQGEDEDNNENAHEEEEDEEEAPYEEPMVEIPQESRSRSPTPPPAPPPTALEEPAVSVAGDANRVGDWLEESRASAGTGNQGFVQAADADAAQEGQGDSSDANDVGNSMLPEGAAPALDASIEAPVERAEESETAVEPAFAPPLQPEPPRPDPPRPEPPQPPAAQQPQAPWDAALGGAPAPEAEAARDVEEEDEEHRRTEDKLLQRLLEENKDPAKGQKIDRGFVKQIAASFVRGMEKRRSTLADKIVKEVAEGVRAYQASADGGEASAAGDAPAPSSSSTKLSIAEQKALEEAMQKLRETREAQGSSDKNFSMAVRKATDACAEASAASVGPVLQKELAKVSDGVALQLAQQLSQSRKFCEALARGLQKSAGGATQQALESLRTPKQMQDNFGAAVTEALHESLEPIFRRELRTHFEQALAPLIGRRIGEMMNSFRDKIGDCLGVIALEHEKVAQRLGDELAPVLAGELKKVERTMASMPSNGPSAHGTGGALSEAELDDITKSVEEEVVRPLQAQIHALKKQVRTLQERSQELERRWGVATSSLVAAVDAAAAGPDGMPPTPCLSGLRQSPAELEEQQALQLERQFRDSRAEDAFTKAIQRQSKACHVDFVGRLCALVPDPAEWFDSNGERPLSEKFKCVLMLALASQLATGSLAPASGREAWAADKVQWINELWLSLDLQDSTVRHGAQDLCKQLTEALDKAPADVGDAAGCLKNLKRQVQKFSQLLRK